MVVQLVRFTFFPLRKTNSLIIIIFLFHLMEFSEQKQNVHHKNRRHRNSPCHHRQPH